MPNFSMDQPLPPSDTLAALRALATLELLPGWHSVAEARGLHGLASLVEELFTNSWASVVEHARQANNPTTSAPPDPGLRQ